jgi:polar amino acid transport system substrate-binding protein
LDVSFDPTLSRKNGLMNLDPTLLAAALAPAGALRACINLGNPILARRDVDGQVRGVSVDLAGELARRLDLPLALVVVETAAQSVQVVAEGRADLGFFAIDPLRGEQIAFTEPYVLIEGSYLVREQSPLMHNDEVDVPGRTVVVGQGSAYDLFLSRSLQNATVVRAPSSQTVVDTFLAQAADVAAGVRQQLEADAQRLGGLRLLPGRFMVIRQAMGCAHARPAAVKDLLSRFVREMRSTGPGSFVGQALARHGVSGAGVAGEGS